jgi:N-acetyl sugar amidotransferase
MSAPDEGFHTAQRCTRCIMSDRDDRRITFDAAGVCSHCHRYDRLLAARVVDPRIRESSLDQLVAAMRRAGRGRDYDCVVGVSGGVDSMYTLWLACSLGLRPLAVHLDNGWNSTLAVANIERAIRRLEVDLSTLVLDWEEFRDLQVAFLKASTPDAEVPTDHAISALLWRTARKHGIRYILSGMNFATESISVPEWSYGHSDWTYIRDVHRRFGTCRLSSYPHFSLPELLWTNGIARVRIVSLLNYIDYRRHAAIDTLATQTGWVSYGGKHHESVYTRWFQGRLLPTKFGIDKRVGHFSDLINSKQMERQSALALLQEPPYPMADQHRDDEYVQSKLMLSDTDFAAIWSDPVRSFRDFRNQYQMVQVFRHTVNRLRSMGLYPR